MARSFFISPMVGVRKSRQVLISSGVGLFSGGTQRTAFVIRQSIKLEPVIGMRTIVAARKSIFAKRLVKQDPGIVTGKRAAGTVGALQSRRQADNQQPPIDRSERWDRSIEPRRLFRTPYFAGSDKPRATWTIAPGLPSAPP